MYHRPNAPADFSVPLLEHARTTEYDAHRAFLLEQFGPDETDAHAAVWVESMRTANHGRWWRAAEVHTVQVVEREHASIMTPAPLVRRVYLVAGPLPAGDVLDADTSARMVPWPIDASDADRDTYRAWLAWRAMDADRTRRALDAGLYD